MKSVHLWFRGLVNEIEKSFHLFYRKYYFPFVKLRDNKNN
jgi:hypothetical protein